MVISKKLSKASLLACVCQVHGVSTRKQYRGLAVQVRANGSVFFDDDDEFSLNIPMRHAHVNLAQQYWKLA